MPIFFNMSVHLFVLITKAREGQILPEDIMNIIDIWQISYTPLVNPIYVYNNGEHMGSDLVETIGACISDSRTSRNPDLDLKEAQGLLRDMILRRRAELAAGINHQ